MRRAAHNLIAKKKEQSLGWVTDLVEMEKLTDYACNPEYMVCFTKLMSQQNEFVRFASTGNQLVTIEGVGKINVSDLYRTPKVVVEEAFDLKMRMIVYWDIVSQRMVDMLALHLRYSILSLVKKEMQMEIITELIGSQGNGLERMLEEPHSVSEKRSKLEKSMKLLKESKDVVANIMDKVVANFD
ncbi:hypothetical protein CASFOL_020114 [Castilleja foliolosa]|uniref:GED domain-containing protein n=1 Tax=Castilleja foliolosa TaxID=1961234 RepID=A0ABD3D445_9LAMI